MILDPPCGYQAPGPARSKAAVGSRVPDKTDSITPINNRCQDDFEKSGLNFKTTALTGGEQVFAQKRLPVSPIRLLLLLL
jgi:hypothetical protein